MAIFLERITATRRGQHVDLELSMPKIDMEVPADPATPAQLSGVKFVNDSDRDVTVTFDSPAPCDPDTFSIQKNKTYEIAWLASVPAAIYTYTASASGGGNVQPVNGDINIEVMRD
jgi:hypothetical protein